MTDRDGKALPDRVWASKAHDEDYGQTWEVSDLGIGDVEYVRADLIEALRQRAEAAEAERDDLIRDIESLKGSETEWLNRALAAEARPAKTAGGDACSTCTR